MAKQIEALWRAFFEQVCAKR